MITDVRSKQLTWKKLKMNWRYNIGLALKTRKQSKLQSKPCTRNKVYLTPELSCTLGLGLIRGSQERSFG